ncbi:MAG: selenocysteine-specific translation elongation factor [Tissierellia bacterium]|nr:selenocysteine-specific translation elongation factor [Tissierellia bacterium]
MNRHIIIGTAGHIDHGKSTLIKALTGRETDTLEEEQKRGITINLGFTYFDLPDGQRAGIIDVPGHEKFVRNMMAGCIGIDIVLLVIAADDGVMPQTIEHADILHYMGVKNAIIVITKIDTVDKEMIDLVEEDIKSAFKNTILKDAPIVKVDSISKKGLSDLTDTITEMSENLKIQNDNYDTRMNIDRVFSLKGLGTIVTGTLVEGEIIKDNEYMIYPYEKYAKIRSIQNHGVDEKKATKGQRTALNITNFHKDELKRGDIIASAHSLIEAKNIQARLSLTDHAKIKLKHWDRVRFFLGTKEVLARVVPLTASIVDSDNSQLVEFRLEEEIYLKNGDRFVIRNYSPVHTIGGGKVIDINQENHTINSKEYIKYLLEKEKFSDDTMILDFLYNFRKFEDIYNYIGKNKNYINGIIQKLTSSNKISKIDEYFISNEAIDRKINYLVDKLNDYHKKFPLEEGMNKNEFNNYIPELSGKSLENFLNFSKVKEKIASTNDKIRNASFKVNTDNNEEDINKKLNEITNKEPELMKYKDLVKSDSDKKIINFLLKDKITRIDDFVIRNDRLEELKQKLIDFTKEKDEFTLAEFRDLSDMSRKMAQAVLEYWDKNKFTKRIGDARVIDKN